jgi:hypothetical protein
MFSPIHRDFGARLLRTSPIPAAGESKHLPVNNCIQIWDTDQKCRVKELLGHDKPLRSLVWLESRGWLASASVNAFPCLRALFTL